MPNSVYQGTDDPYRFVYDHVEIIEALGHFIAENERLSEIESIIVEPMDIRNHGPLGTPNLSIFTASNIRSDATSTEAIGYVLDENGGEIGEWFETTFDMTVQMDLREHSQTEYNVSKIGSKLEIELLRFDSNNNDGFIPKPDTEDEYITNIDTFTVDSGRRIDFEGPVNSTEQVSMRRWMTEVDISFHYLINTVDLYGRNDYVTTINYPEYGDFQKSHRPEIEIQADPSLPDA